MDYDEIAHHAGVQRPEALRALEGLDRVLSQLERVVRYAPRPYRFVCERSRAESGATFKQRYGKPLEEVVRELMVWTLATSLRLRRTSRRGARSTLSCRSCSSRIR